MDCIFCKITAGEIPSKKVYEDEKILAFHDIQPVAPVHVLVIPKVHMDSLNEINSANADYVSHLMQKLPEIAASQNLAGGYRVVTNIGNDGRQSVQHLHFHVLGGRKLGIELG